MTALKPIESRDVRAVSSETYPSNKVCAHPDCNEKVQLRPNGTPTVHHAFPRSQTGSASYFVSIDGGEPTPHAVGLCGSGTTGHHGDVEDHRAKLTLEEGVWKWYERTTSNFDYELGEAEWKLVGPLNPQPGSVEAKPKRRVLKGEAKRNRANWQVKVPKDNLEDGAGILDELFEACIDHLAPKMDKQPEDGTPYTWLAACLAVVLQS